MHRSFPRFPVAKLYYRHSDLTSTVCGRWQYIYYDALCRNFSFAVLCKSKQSVTVLWNRMLPASNLMTESFVRLEGPICCSLRLITCSHDPICMEFKSCVLRFVHGRSRFFHVAWRTRWMRHPTVTVHGLLLSATLTRVCGGVDLEFFKSFNADILYISLLLTLHP